MVGSHFFLSHVPLCYLPLVSGGPGGHWLLSASELRGPCNRPSSPGERTHLPPPPLSRSLERRRFVSGLGRTPAEVSAMLRCVLQRANNLRHSDPLAGVVFRGKRILGDSGKTNTGQLVHIRFHSIHCFHM